MSTATEKLESGRQALVAYHGESLTWVPASSVLKASNGQVLLADDGKAQVGDPENNLDFEGIFDEFYARVDAAQIVTVSPAVSNVSADDLPDAQRGDLVLRGSEQFFVLEVQADGYGAIVLILSKHAH